MTWNIFKRDKLICGALAGALANIIMDFFEMGFQKAGLIKFTLDQFAGSMIIRDKAALMTGWGLIIGFLAGAALCIILGVIFVYLIEFTGFQGIILKGLLYGFILWFLIYGGVKSGLHISYLQDYDPQHAFFNILFHLIFGSALGIIVLKLWRPVAKEEDYSKEWSVVMR